ncbi:IS66 family insertion sequence element accessory protein TnpA [Sporolactobacillus terrae]|uniref:Uncharacterized protein n=1 Tax=Sporolactobacillus terrae TaxID=269673 RepID=A0A5K7X063_9BACL|nr:helix-turn-helix domain-containing protein [Sporolactobacillus terrae]RYL96235.1 helix-turn-helix domain-containing protein [Sporolactobacillus sp. THM7-7]BBN97854.1 hypothetical protein St703_05590 [Sporolactobacillus terrae]BBN98059.1 hypothetical protein St703_07640 [Sporolactobacillus terrae]BBO00013.1 hypothetical protein St703_27170 [Sporolactobacillus terrae]BBO00322.1 hypothetical protein St703_30260 [Sporolactobacillus terrae]
MTRAELQELWQERINDFEASHLNGIQWCANHNISLSQFRYWRRKLCLTAPQASRSKDRWVSVDLTDSARQNPLLIQLGTMKIEVHPGFNPDLLADVVRVLRVL